MMTSRKAVTKKLINSPEACVDDNLRGVVATFPRLHLHPKHRVITNRQTTTDTGRVAVLGGGGSGHEPFAAGLIGEGMLDGAVAGGVFASPPTGHVLYAIAQLYKYNSGGVIVIIGNYTGDRLNFGKAIEKAKINGIKVIKTPRPTKNINGIKQDMKSYLQEMYEVEGLIVGEDVASSHNKTGGRSMCGEVFFYKLCAAMALDGYELMELKEIAAEANKYMATLGVCLSPCSLPGQPPLFEIAEDEIELGAGVHGEAGISKLKMGSATEIVKLILDKIKNHLKLSAGDRVAVMLDNLGGTSFMEMNILAAETKSYLESKKIKVERIFSGHMKTSLEMHGFQICLLHLNRDHGDLWLKLLDAPTEALGWCGGPLSIADGLDNIGDDDSLLKFNVKQKLLGPALTIVEQDLLRECLEKAANELIRHEEILNKLDSGCGDGDCGTTMKKFANAIITYLKGSSMEFPSSVLWELSDIAETDMGGTSGGIYSLGLSAASQAIAGFKTLNAAGWLTAWESGMSAISKYGGAEPGDRTMLDALNAAAVDFKRNISKDTKTAAKMAKEAAEQGAKSTANMSASAGRASYVSSEYLKEEDAGARAVAVWLNAIFDVIVNFFSIPSV